MSSSLGRNVSEGAHSDVQFAHVVSETQLHAAVNAVYGDSSVVTCGIDTIIVRDGSSFSLLLLLQEQDFSPDCGIVSSAIPFSTLRCDWRVRERGNVCLGVR